MTAATISGIDAIMTPLNRKMTDGMTESASALDTLSSNP